MTAKEAYDLFIVPTLRFLGPSYDRPEAELMLLAIGIVESGFRARNQVPVAHAHGWWMFEKGGGCAEFAVNKKMAALRGRCIDLGLKTTATFTYAAIATGADNLACIMARGLLYADTMPLPEIGNRDGAYAYYIRCWRPGKPSKARWNASYQIALGVMGLTEPPVPA